MEECLRQSRTSPQSACANLFLHASATSRLLELFGERGVASSIWNTPLVLIMLEDFRRLPRLRVGEFTLDAVSEGRA